VNQDLYTAGMNTAAGTLLLTAVLVVWRRELRAMVMLLACQGVALAALPIVDGIAHASAEVIGVGVAILALRGVVLPAVLLRLVARRGPARRGPARWVPARRESAPVVGTSLSLLITALLTVTAFAVTRPIVRLQATVGSMAVPVSFAVILIGIQVMATRRRALSQTVGFLMLDNGITSAAFLLTSGVPLVVELGASLDVLFVTLVLGLLARQVQAHFGDSDVGRLRELRD
jgi:hydrogenase-4 component E